MSIKSKNLINLVESFDQDKLYHILNHKSEFKDQIAAKHFHDDKDPFLMIKKYLAASTLGNIKVKYFQHNAKGRYFAIKSLSLANMPRKFRHTVAKDIYHDIDMVNAHPVILKFICKENEIECNELIDYINDREINLQELEVDRTRAKEIYLTIINGKSDAIGWVKCKKTKNLKRFAAEIKTIREKLIALHTTDFNAHKKYSKKNGRKDNFDGSFMNILLCDVENKILQCIHQYFKSPENAVLCFDGIMLEKDCSPYDLQACEAHIKEIINIDVKLAIKEMDDGFDIPNPDKYTEISIDDIVPFDRNDSYLWMDFYTEYGGNNNFDDYDELCKEVLPKLKKVFAYIGLGKGFYIKKTDNFENLYDISSTKTDFFITFKYEDAKYALSLHKFVAQNAKHLAFNKTCIKPNQPITTYEFNLWTGFKGVEVEEVDMELIAPMLDILKSVWANADDTIYKSLLHFFSQQIKTPEEMIRVAIMLFGEQGIGKDFFIQFFSDFVLGRHLVADMIGIHEAVCDFNHHLQGKKLCVVNEMASTKNEFRSNFDKIKPFITNKNIDIQRKGIDKYQVENISNWIFFSNHRDSMYIEKGDRRYICLEGGNVYKGNHAHFKSVKEQCFNEKCGNHFYTYLMRLTEEDVVDITTLETTPLKKEMLLMSENSVETWLHDVTNKDKPKIFKTSRYLYSVYKEWCIRVQEHSFSEKKFISLLKKTYEPERKRVGRGFTINYYEDILGDDDESQ